MRAVVIGVGLALVGHTLANPGAQTEKVMGKAFMPAAPPPPRVGHMSLYPGAPIASADRAAVANSLVSTRVKSIAHLRREILKVEDTSDRMKAELERVRFRMAIMARAIPTDTQNWTSTVFGFGCLAYGIVVTFFCFTVYRFFIQGIGRVPAISMNPSDGARLRSSAATPVPWLISDVGLRTACIAIGEGRGLVGGEAMRDPSPIEQYRKGPLSCMAYHSALLLPQRGSAAFAFGPTRRVQRMDMVATDRRPLYAVLVDAENATYSSLAAIVEEIATLGGDANVRRVYADFTKPDLAPWKWVSVELSFKPVTTFSYVSGKGSSDAVMMIDAMKLLFKDKVDGFAIVSSDSDFTPLAQELREAGKFVVGFGQRMTPASFVTACDRFIYIENLGETATETKGLVQDLSAKRRVSKKDFRLLKRVIDDASDEEGWVELGCIGRNILAIKSDFDVRSYGYKKLVELFRDHASDFELRVVRRTISVRRVEDASIHMKDIDKLLGETATETKGLVQDVSAKRRKTSDCSSVVKRVATQTRVSGILI